MQRFVGQIHGVLKIMEEEKDCKGVFTQLSAIHSIIDLIVKSG